MIVQIDKHRRALRSCHEEIFEFSEDVRANRIHLICGGEPSISVLGPKNVEVVEPEIGHHFLELPLAVYRTNDLLPLKLLEKLLRQLESPLLVERLYVTAQFRLVAV